MESWDRAPSNPLLLQIFKVYNNYGKTFRCIKNGRIAKLRDGKLVLAFPLNGENHLYDYVFLNENTKLNGNYYLENGIYSCDRYGDDSKNDIVAVYKVELNSLESMRIRIKNFDEGQTQWGVEKVWETPKDIEIDFDTLLNAMAGNSLLEWLLTPNEIAVRVNEMIKNPNYKNNEHFINELKCNIPALRDAESFYVEKEPGEYW